MTSWCYTVLFPTDDTAKISAYQNSWVFHCPDEKLTISWAQRRGRRHETLLTAAARTACGAHLHVDVNGAQSQLWANFTGLLWKSLFRCSPLAHSVGNLLLQGSWKKTCDFPPSDFLSIRWGFIHSFTSLHIDMLSVLRSPQPANLGTGLFGLLSRSLSAAAASDKIIIEVHFWKSDDS